MSPPTPAVRTAAAPVLIGDVAGVAEEVPELPLAVVLETLPLDGAVDFAGMPVDATDEAVWLMVAQIPSPAEIAAGAKMTMSAEIAMTGVQSQNKHTGALGGVGAALSETGL